MRFRGGGAAWVVLAAWFSSTCATLAAAPTTVALTLTAHEAGEAKKLGERLLPLVDAQLRTDKSLSLVARGQIELPSKPLAADYLLQLETLPADRGSPAPYARLRVVDGKTAAIRGVTVAALDAATLEDAARQFAHYATAVIRWPEKPLVSVAVTPFESKGLFVRLRPLEIGIRDLLVAQLLALSGAKAAEADAKPSAQGLGFLVLERSNLDQLAHEIELAEAGAGEKPAARRARRGAAYLVRGEIDERQADAVYTIIVRGEMVDAPTKQVVERFSFECTPGDLEGYLAGSVEKIGKVLRNGDQSVHPAVAKPALAQPGGEVEALLQLALADVQRFQRRDSLSHSYPDFFAELPGRPTRAGPGVPTDDPLAPHLLKKSIDRLEAVLFIAPDNIPAAYALAYCYSLHQAGAYRPEKTDELLRKVFAAQPETKLGVRALFLLADCSFDEQTGKLTEVERKVASERVWFAFEQMPPQFRDKRWVSLITLLGNLYPKRERTEELAELVTKIAPFVDTCSGDVRLRLASQWAGLALQVAAGAGGNPALHDQVEQLFRQWAGSDVEELAELGSNKLVGMLSSEGKFYRAAEMVEETAAKMKGLDRPQRRERHDRRLLDAVNLYRRAQEPARALKLLESIELPAEPYNKEKPTYYPPWADYQFELGCCYQKLNQKQKALQTFIAALEKYPELGTNGGLADSIKSLGGFPLDPDRDVAVKYFPFAESPQGDPMCMATNGTDIYLGTSTGLRQFHLKGTKWETVPLKNGAITCLGRTDELLWVGTKTDGLWQYHVRYKRWEQIAKDKLPDRHVQSLTVSGYDVYAGVGTTAAGGLIHIGRDRKLSVFTGPNAPTVAPIALAVTEKGLLALTPITLHEWSRDGDHWSVQPSQQWQYLLTSPAGVWATGHKDLSIVADSPAASDAAQPVAKTVDAINEFRAGRQRPGLIRFVSQRGDQWWFGGEQWTGIISSGLYRIDSKTEKFDKFGPRQGFKLIHWQAVYDGLWLKDDLWLATSEGLCRVKPQKK